MGILSKLFGEKPKVPKFTKIEFDDKQEKALAGNIAVTGEAGRLALLQQEADQETLEQGLKRAIYGYKGLVTGEREVIGDMLAGKVNTDVADRLRDYNAARGIATGTQGSQAIDFSELRNYGLTSMQQQEKGLVAAQNWKSWQYNYGMAKQMSVTSMFMSPQARMAHETSERNTEFSRDWLAAKITAAPDPRFVGVAKGLTAAIGGGWGTAGQAAFGMQDQGGGAGGFGGFLGGIFGFGGSPTGGYPQFVSGPGGSPYQLMPGGNSYSADPWSAGGGASGLAPRGIDAINPFKDL